MSPRQAALDFPPVARNPVDTFVTGPGTAGARRVLGSWRAWPTGALAVVAPAKAGKSHLAAVWAAEVGAAVTTPAAFRGAGADVLARMGSAPVAVDGMGETPTDDEGLMTVLDAVRDGGVAPVAFFARRPPEGWPTRRADLPSRLSVVPSVTFDPPDEAELAQILMKLFADRGLSADQALTDYLLARIECTVPAAVAVVEAIDRAALETQSPLTRRLAGAVLAGRTDCGDEEPFDAYHD